MRCAFIAFQHCVLRWLQAPPDLTTILSVLKLPDKEDVAKVLFNYLLDSQHVERKVLVPVSTAACFAPKPIRTPHAALLTAAIAAPASLACRRYATWRMGLDGGLRGSETSAHRTRTRG